MSENSTNLIRFHKKWVQDNFKSEQQGRPVGEEFDYIEIRAVGQQQQVVIRKVRTQDELDYSREWDLYQRGIEQVAEGTPLREWPVMTHDDILRLNSYAVHTIEALAGLSDAGMQQIGPGTRDLQKRAKAFLEEDAPKAAAVNLRIENEGLRTKVGQLEAQVAELVATPDSELVTLVPVPAVPDTRMDDLEAKLAELAAAQAAKPAKRGPGRRKNAA